jgi:hypothetical protein
LAIDRRIERQGQAIKRGEKRRDVGRADQATKGRRVIIPLRHVVLDKTFIIVHEVRQDGTIIT